MFVAGSLPVVIATPFDDASADIFATASNLLTSS